MFLYELALQMGIRSADLVAHARSLGMDVEQGSYLDQAQVAHLWSAFQQQTPPEVPQFLPPTPPPPPPGAQGLTPGTPPHAWGAPADPSASADAGGDETRPVVVAAAIVALVVLAGVLVFLSGGSDEQPAKLAASGTSAAEPAPRSTTTITIPPDEPMTDPPVDASVDELIAMVRDRHRFCSGARGIFEMEDALYQPFVDGDLDAVASAVRANRESWDTAVEDLELGTSGLLQNDVTVYTSAYRMLFEGAFEAEVGAAPSLGEFERTRATVALSAGRINAAMFELCT